jgi:hypothetical protein
MGPSEADDSDRRGLELAQSIAQVGSWDYTGRAHALTLAPRDKVGAWR